MEKLGLATYWEQSVEPDSCVYVCVWHVHFIRENVMYIFFLFLLETQMLIPKAHASPAMFHSFTLFVCPLKECEFGT